LEYCANWELHPASAGLEVLLPGTDSIENPSRRERSDPYPRLINRPDRCTAIRPNHTVPYGTVPFLHGYQAINCLATIIQSLREKVRHPPYGTSLTTGSERSPTAPHRLSPYSAFLYRDFDVSELPASTKPSFSKSGIVPVNANGPGIYLFPAFIGLTG
jgi:hypothetical protein